MAIQNPGDVKRPPNAEQLEELRRMGEADQRWNDFLLWAIAEDAKSGNVQDPKKRNVKGRDDPRQSRQAGQRTQEGAGQQGTLNAESRSTTTDSRDTRTDPVESASNSLGLLRESMRTEREDLGGNKPKLVDLSKLV